MPFTAALVVEQMLFVVHDLVTNQKMFIGTKNGGTDRHSVVDWTRELPAVWACLKTGVWEICRRAGPR